MQHLDLMNDLELLSVVLSGKVTESGLRDAFRLQQGEKVTPAKQAKFDALQLLMKRQGQARIKELVGNVLSQSRRVFLPYKEKFAGEKKEHFHALYLDSKNRVVKEELISIGSLNFSIVHPREVFKPAVEISATSIILVHNHPSNDPTPSQEDIAMTKRLVEVGKIMGIEILDHIIIGGDVYLSFLEQKLM